jgi:hypothetical protein
MNKTFLGLNSRIRNTINMKNLNIQGRSYFVLFKVCLSLSLIVSRFYTERGRDRLKHMDENGIRRRRRKPTKSVAIIDGMD